MKTEQPNQRNFFRCHFSIFFNFSILHKDEVLGPYSGETINLSGGGMLFKTECPLLQTGNLILAEFLEAGPEELNGDLIGRIIREVQSDDNRAGNDDEERVYLLAVEFKFPHKADPNQVLAYLNRRAATEKNNLID